MTDGEVVAAQIGRPLRAAADVVVRCHLDLPVVTKVPPLLDDGTPFPTTYWLTCPLATRRIGRLEAAGGVKAMERYAEVNVEFGARLQAAHDRYAADRDHEMPEGHSPAPSGGVAGSARGVKCLHAHYADHAVGKDNPVGEATAPFVEPLNCSIACVTAGKRNPAWIEPR